MQESLRFRSLPLNLIFRAPNTLSLSPLHLADCTARFYQVSLWLAVSQGLCPWGNMVAFPEKPGEERREGPYTEENPRENPKESGRADQDHERSSWRPL